MGSRLDFACQAGPGDWVLTSIEDLLTSTQRLGLPMGWCLFPVPHGVIFAHNVVDFRELDAYSDKTVIVIDINNTPLDSFADCCGFYDDEDGREHSSSSSSSSSESGRRNGGGRGLVTYTEVRFNPKPDRHSDSDSAASASGSRDASFTHNRLLSARNDVNNSSSSSSSSSASEDNQERSSNTEAYLPPPPVDSRTIVYKTQKRFFSAVDVVDLLKSTESYQVF